ncbi:MAG TPA: Gfo/Idh/MocA family oxidoreductase, partial [Firmicutes bacterium]|nr:Gfo/Idh/MocA family oxidoreductase [Bacillota bacterium]
EAGVDLCVAGKFKDNQDERGLLNDGIHLIDAMRWFCGGDFVEVEAYAAFSDPHKEKTLVAEVRFDTGALGVFTMSRSAGQWMEVVELHGGGRSARIDFPSTFEFITQSKVEVSDFKAKDWAWAIDVPWKGGFTQELEHFFECVRTRKEPLTSGRDALKTHRLVNEIYRCAGLPLLD